MGLDVLLQILRTLEGLTTEVALMRLEWYVDTNMRRDVVALHGGGSACAPLAGKIEVVCALAADMTLANVVLVSVLVAALACDARHDVTSVIISPSSRDGLT